MGKGQAGTVLKRVGKVGHTESQHRPGVAIDKGDGDGVPGPAGAPGLSYTAAKQEDCAKALRGTVPPLLSSRAITETQSQGAALWPVVGWRT